MITRITETFKSQEIFFLQTQVGVVYTDFKLEDGEEASVSLIPHPTYIYAVVAVSRSVEALMNGKDHPFEVSDMDDGGCLFSVHIRNQTDATRLEKEIKHLLTLHMFGDKVCRLQSHLRVAMIHQGKLLEALAMGLHPRLGENSPITTDIFAVLVRIMRG